MVRRASLCHVCDITNPGEITGYVNGRPKYATVTVSNVPCRFYSLKGPVTKTESGVHVISVLRIRVPLETSISTGSIIIGKSPGFTDEYAVDGLPEVVYAHRHPRWIECSLKSVDGEA